MFIGSKYEGFSEAFECSRDAKYHRYKCDSAQRKIPLIKLHKLNHTKGIKSWRGIWKASKKPEIKNSEFSWTGFRPYVNLASAGGKNGLSLKLNEPTYGIYFQFYSHNNKRQHYGRSPLNDLILTDGTRRSRVEPIITPAIKPIVIPISQPTAQTTTIVSEKNAEKIAREAQMD